MARKEQIVFLLFLLTLSFTLKAQGPNAIPDRLIVHFSDEVNEKKILSELSAQFVFSSYPIAASMHIRTLQFKDIHDAPAALSLLRNKKEVIAAQYDHFLEYRSTIPTDSLFGNQWYLNNTGFGPYPPDVDVDAPEAWDSATGRLTAYGDTIVVAVIDVRTDLNHPDLNFFRNEHEIPGDTIDNDGNGYLNDYLGWNAWTHNDDVNGTSGSHATQLAGIVGAKQNGFGTVGVTWGVKIMPLYCQAIESQAVESYAYVLNMRRLYNLSGGSKGAYVVSTNTSFGIDRGKPVDFPIWCAMYDSLGKYGILNAAATANTNIDIDAEGDMPTACASNFLITVTSTNGYDQRDPNSGYGDTTIDIGAPGVGIYSTIAPSGYGTGNGTSFAAPILTGEVALLISYACPDFLELYNNNPDTAALLLKQYILEGVDPNAELAGKTVTGGRVNLFKAIQQMSGFSCAGCASRVLVNYNPPSCQGDSNGSASVRNMLPGMQLRYAWSTGDTTASVSNLRSGTYTVSVTDSSGCTRSTFIRIPFPVPLSFNTLEVTSYNYPDSGSILAMGQGGTPPYQYSVDGIHYQSSTFFPALSYGNYRIYIRDSRSCIHDTLVSIGNHTGIEIPNEYGSFRILQNPVQNELQFEYSSSDGEVLSMRVYDILGRPFTNPISLPSSGIARLQKIDTSAWPNGVYLLAVSKGLLPCKTLPFVK